MKLARCGKCSGEESTGSSPIFLRGGVRVASWGKQRSANDWLRCGRDIRTFKVSLRIRTKTKMQAGGNGNDFGK
jgi:hypothetical protein